MHMNNDFFDVGFTSENGIVGVVTDNVGGTLHKPLIRRYRYVVE